MNLRGFLFILLLIFSADAFAGGSKKLLQNARKSLAKADYAEAKKYYNQLLQSVIDNPEYFFEAGIAYYNSDVEKEKALGYFQSALRLSTTDTIAEIHYYLGKSYQYLNEFNKAIEQFNLFKNQINSNSKYAGTLIKEVDRAIEMCNNGQQLIQTENKKIDIKNLGSHVNSIFSEYAPVVKKDESLLIFTARKNNNEGHKFYHDNKKFEDIYVATIEDKNTGTYSYSTKFDSSGTYISHKINSKFHDAAIGYNDAEDKLFIYRQNDVWMSELKDGKWSDPVRMNSNINTKGHEPSVYITSDEKILYFVSNRADGLGGRDIWYATKDASGEWGEIKNMGPTINTPYDEDAPFVTKDGKTFYFSSRGHNSIGGYDIFKSELGENGAWQTPVNVGLPINSGGEDIYYILSEDATYAYLSSSRAYGFGVMDIYRAQLECKSIPNTEVRGFIVGTDKRIPISSKIMVTEKESGKQYGPFYSDAYTGKYMLILPPEKTYALELVCDAFPASRPHKEEFTIPKQCEYFQLFQEIKVSKVKDSSNNQFIQTAEFKNAFFDIKKKSAEKFDFDILKDDNTITTPENLDLTFTPVLISGNIGHNTIQKAKKVDIYLIDKNKQIIKTTKSDDNGNFVFSGLDPNQSYSVLIKEDDLKISYYGDSKNNANKEVVAAGKLELLKGLEGEIKPMENVDVVLIDNSKKTLNTTTTNEKGEFRIDNVNTTNTNPLYANLNYPYRINKNDLDMIYSAYITTIRKDSTDLNYTEYIDIINYPIPPELLAQFENIYFDFDKYFLRDRSKEIMDKIADYMLSHPDTKIEIAGHCDWMGSDEYNVVLSERRSISAFNYLLNKGINADRMRKLWFGESKPAASNTLADGSDNPEGRQLNRRVEFKLNVPGMAMFTIQH